MTSFNARISTIPAMPKGATGNLQYGSGKTYTVTATFPDGRSCSARFAYGTPAGEVEEKWAKAVAKIPKPAKAVPVEERNRPTTEPFLTEWLALHKQHLKALREGRKDPLRLCDAVKLADAKYEVYRSEITAAAELTLRRVRKGVVRVTAKGKAK